MRSLQSSVGDLQDEKVGSFVIRDVARMVLMRVQVNVLVGQLEKVEEQLSAM